MMKINFTDSELKVVLQAIKNKLTMYVNRAGNITVMIPGDKTQKWTLYKTPSGYLWRHIEVFSGYTYPLNMKNRKNGVIKHEYTGWDGKLHEYYSYNIDKNCTFITVVEAVNYFKRYMTKYRNIKLL